MDSRGTSFTTAFPENIAFYFPKTYNLLKITVLFNDTAVNITSLANGNSTTKSGVSNGTILTLNLTKDVEEYRFVPSNKSFRITSNKNITVLSVSGWEGRFQSHVVEPDQNLGTVYQVPLLNIQFTNNQFQAPATLLFNLRLMIINAADKDNTVTIKKVDPSGQSLEDKVTLGPLSLIQIKTNVSVKEINAEFNVSVILTHPCLDGINCSCNMVRSQLKPQSSGDQIATFPVPPIFNITQIQVTTKRPFRVAQGVYSVQNSITVYNSTDILPLFSNNLNQNFLISTSVPVTLHLISPGLILDIMSTSMFSGCFLVDFNSTQSGALVIANTSSTSGVQINDQPLASNVMWRILNGTGFSWAMVEAQQIGTIWHQTDKIDRSGCLLNSENFVLGDDKMSWSLSREYCMETADELATLNTLDNQNKLSLYLAQEEVTDGWISLRRSLYSTNWYWKSEDHSPPNVTFTYWAYGQPEKPEKGLCASISLDTPTKFMWKSARCCSENKPVCFNRPKYFSFNKTVHQMLNGSSEESA
ncbi:hypothetical protein DNTS_020342 [Danionella cerebrum]|uniref:C-type lectin domain-containing protein n=1 Tax=Danionella cerebrum TaxID=2873325 RepID=A0A553MUT2_9TELE|nr:hypothetical protein DNTS_020342 [Danionella translucida]